MTTPLMLSLTPVMLARAGTATAGQSPFRVDREAAGVRPVPYTLKLGETVAQVTGKKGEADGADTQAQQVAGRFLSDHPDGDAAASMVKGMALGKANQTVQDWMSQFGVAQVQFGVDDDFSLKSSSLSLLYPWYDIPENMVFSQTDDCTQTNIGMGYRHFRASDMLGGNIFINYDLSCDHAPIGFGGEY
ncbi:inverse autotransporter beta domain-containing protein (plasmid) [Salmonella enterica subsp. salamae]|nr:hypothetical protein [Salmonella enterica]EGT8498716.1 hypothetical protein [Salmonella enterica]EJJ3518316.1 inverse autotransporter beta domain-containing protein [Salmonella enterica]QVP66138.1 inverse autotransporter beta domain-containing protein [Salmonella enterica subsp. salamae]